jgi:CAAX protease family protein
VNALLSPHRRTIWVAWLVAALLFLAVGNGLIYGLIVPLSAGLLVLLAPGVVSSAGRHVDGRDIRTVLLLYVGVVIALYLAFQVFTVERTLWLFLCYAAGLILGVVGPVIYTVWRRGRPLADLGLTRKNWRQAVGLGLVLGAIQFFLTLYAYDLPAPVEWVPLLTMSLMVGLFEAIFFRGFVQTRLSASFRTGPRRGRSRGTVCLVPRRLRHGSPRNGVPVRAWHGLRHRVRLREQCAGSLAAADTPWLVLQQPPGR